MFATIIQLLQSKRFIAAIVGLFVAVLVYYIPDLPEEAAIEVFAIILGFVLSQTLADVGKEKAARALGLSAAEARAAVTGFWESKKVFTALVGVIVVVLLHFIPDLPEDVATAFVTTVLGWLLSQGVVDIGKEAQKLFDLFGRK